MIHYEQEKLMDERERLIAEMQRVGPCDQRSSGVYCGKWRSPTSAAGLCGNCGQRQAIRDKIDALPQPAADQTTT